MSKPKDGQWEGEIFIELRQRIRGLAFRGESPTVAEVGTYRGCSNRNGAVSAYLDDGRVLGARPHEVVRWWYTWDSGTVFVWGGTDWEIAASPEAEGDATISDATREVLEQEQLCIALASGTHRRAQA